MISDQDRVLIARQIEFCAGGGRQNNINNAGCVRAELFSDSVTSLSGNL